MAMAIIHHPQSRANLLREALRGDPVVKRAGIRFREVEGSEDGLRVVVWNGSRLLRLARGPEWRGEPLARLKQSVRGQLAALSGVAVRGHGRVRRPSRSAAARVRGRGYPGPAGATRGPGKGPSAARLRVPVVTNAPVLAGPRGPPLSLGRIGARPR